MNRATEAAMIAAEQAAEAARTAEEKLHQKQKELEQARTSLATNPSDPALIAAEASAVTEVTNAEMALKQAQKEATEIAKRADDAIKAEVKGRMDPVGKKRASSLQKDVEGINSARDDLLVATIKQVVRTGKPVPTDSCELDQYLETTYGDKYRTFRATQLGARTMSADIATEISEQFLRGKDSTGRYYVPMSRKLTIIAEHSNNQDIYEGDDKFSADLEDTQKIKADAKKRYRARADKLEADYQSIIDENEVLINELRQKIKEIEAKKLQEESRIIPEAGTVTTITNGIQSQKERTQADVDHDKQIQEQNVAKFEKDLEELRAKLARLEKVQGFYVSELEKRKDAIETMLAEAKIFRGAEQTSEPSDSKESSSDNKLMSANPLTTPREIARSMINDFYRRTPEEQKVILSRCGSRDLLRASEHLGMISRRKLATVLKDRLAEMDMEKDVSTGEEYIQFGTERINRNTLSARTLRLTDEQRRAIIQEISEFNEHIGEKTPTEIMEFEKKIEALRFATYRDQTGWFRNLTRRLEFLDFGTFRRHHQIGEISSRLAKYAMLKDEREVNREERENRFRAALKLKRRHSLVITNPHELDRTGTDAIYTQDYAERDDD